MEQERFDLKILIKKALRYWYAFAIILPLSLLLCYTYLRYTPPKYEASALLLIEDDEGSGQPSEEAVFAELGLGKKAANVENEIMILKSTPLLQKVVQNLKLQYNYFSLGQLHSIDLYKNSPVEVLDWQPADPKGGLYVEILADGKGGYSLEVEIAEEAKRFRGEFGKDLELPLGKLALARSNDMKADYPIGILIVPEWQRAKSLAARLEVELVSDNSSIVNMSIRDVAPERAHDVLMELIDVYNIKTIADKNHVYKNTIDLINERIQLISEELSAGELDVETYKRRFNMVELSSEGSLLMSEMMNYNKELSSIEIQLEILNSIEDFLVENREKFEFVPTNMTINNLTLANQLSSFNELLAELERMKNDLGPSHPDFLLAQKQIQNLRGTIIDNIRAIKSDLQITRKANLDQKDDLGSRISSLPRRERELIEMQRQNSVTENLYLYLLQKREESVISLSATTAKGTIIEPAGIPDAPVSPNEMQLWLIAAFFGLAIPAGIVGLVEHLNDKVEYEDDVEQLTSVPVAGAIGYHRGRGHLVVKENTRSVVSEMFRLLRANLAYLDPAKNMKVLLVTSSVSGEGKSFMALNLAMVLALAGKKILLLELDLRRPKQEIYSQVEFGKQGIVNYLADPSMQAFEIIRNSGLHPGLDLISSGPIPPNASELLLSDRLRKLIDALKEPYDMIILDAPPIGAVADAFQLNDIADATMYIVRFGFTRRAQLQIIKDIAQKHKLPKPFIVMNAVPLNKQNYGYGYGYSYGYGHSSHSYYTKNGKGGMFGRLGAKFQS